MTSSELDMEKNMKEGCKLCSKSRKKIPHACLRHSPCIDLISGAWNPENCSECIALFKKADSSDKDNGTAKDALKDLAYKIKEKCSNTNYEKEGTIFSSLFALQKFNRTWFRKATYTHSSKPKEMSGKVVGSDQRPSIATPLGDLVDNLVNETVNSSSLIPDEDFQGVLNPRSSERSVHAGPSSSTYMTGDLNHQFVDPSGRRVSDSGPSVQLPAGPSLVDMDGKINRLYELFEKNSEMLANFQTAITHKVTPPLQNTESQIRGRVIEDNHSETELQTSTDSDEGSSEEEESVPHTQTTETQMTPEEENEIPDLIHWPGCEFLTDASSDMVDFLNKEIPPTAYMLPKVAKFNNSGWDSSEGYLSFEKIFIGEYKENKIVIFKEKNKAASKLIPYLTRLSSIKTKTPSLKKSDSLRIFSEYNCHIKDVIQTHPEDDNKFMLKGNDEALLKKLKPLTSKPKEEEKKKDKINSLPWKFQAESTELQKALDLLQAQSLDKDCHEVSTVSQRMTSITSPSRRAEDFEARKQANICFTNSVLLSQMKTVLNHVLTGKASQEEIQSSLLSLGDLTETLELTSDMMLESTLSRVVKKRLAIREEAVKHIKDADICQTLVEGPCVGTKLFNEDSTTSLGKIVQNPAPRKVDLTNPRFKRTNSRAARKATHPYQGGSSSRQFFRGRGSGSFPNRYQRPNTSRFGQDRTRTRPYPAVADSENRQGSVQFNGTNAYQPESGSSWRGSQRGTGGGRIFRGRGTQRGRGARRTTGKF